MALHAGHWIQRPWLSGLHWLDTIVVRIRPATRSNPSEIARAPLARGERILAISTAADQPSAIGTTHALHYHGDGWTRIGWEELDHVTWHPGTGTLTLTGHDGRPPVSLRLTEPGRLPAVSRDRVAAAVIATSEVALHPGHARITVRRQPGTDSLVWTVQLRGDQDPADVDVQCRVDAAVHTMRCDLGV